MKLDRVRPKEGRKGNWLTINYLTPKGKDLLDKLY